MRRKSVDREKKDLLTGCLGAVGGAYLMSASVFVLAYACYLIVRYAGIWWLPIITTILVSIGIPVASWIEKRERADYHMQVGHELYYSENPKELEKDLKKARKSGIATEVQRTAAYYRNRPTKVKQFTDRREKKRRVKAVLLFIGAVIAALMGISLIWRAFPIPQGIFEQKLKTADFTPIFLIIGGILVLASALGLFLGKTVKAARGAAVIALILSVWSALVAFSLNKRPTYMDGAINAVCLVAFLLTAFIIPAIAGDVRTAEQVSRDKKELKISLYELGYIKEEELREIY